MSLFLLDCDSASSTASSFSSMADKLKTIISSINGYDTSCEDGFDFSSAKSVIASNVEACATKMSNTSSLINSVVTSHTNLQKKLNNNDEKTIKDKNGKKNDTNNKSQISSSVKGSYSSSGGGSYSGSGGGNYFAGGVTALATAPVATSASQLRTTIDTFKEIKSEVKEVLCVPFDKSKLSEEFQRLFLDNKLKYSSDGYFMINNRYIISCDESFGEVGDRIIFVRKDGTKVDCIIGHITRDEASRNRVTFFVDNNKWTKDNKNNITGDFVGSISKIINIGKTQTFANESIKSAVNWAVDIANDNSHGYSQLSRWGETDYDCSSLIISAYENAGVPVKEAGASYTGDMKEAFTKVGFNCYNYGSVELQPGDVLLRNGHTEMYIGNGKNVGAHSNRDGINGDSSGSEINVADNSDSWTWVLRYNGNNKVISV